MVTNKDAPIKNRFMEHILSAFISALVIWFIGWLAGFTELKAEVMAINKAFAAHERQNAEYRERMAKERENEDRKWDARIGRIENCFIIRNCGK